MAVDKHKWVISNEFEGFQTEPMCTDSRRTMVLNSQVTRAPSINTGYCFRNVEMFFIKYFQLRLYMYHRLLIITVHLITTSTLRKKKKQAKEMRMTFLPITSKLHLKKKGLKTKLIEAGETKGHFYLFTFTFYGFLQTETIWICTHFSELGKHSVKRLLKT